jgi:VanZ family protein
MKWIAALFTLFILAVILLADLGRLPAVFRAASDYPFGDKLGHFVLFALLSLFITLTAVRSIPGCAPARLGLKITLVLGVLVSIEEGTQRYISTRSPDWVDLGASLLGLIIGASAAVWWSK